MSEVKDEMTDAGEQTPEEQKRVSDVAGEQEVTDTTSDQKSKEEKRSKQYPSFEDILAIVGMLVVGILIGSLSQFFLQKIGGLPDGFSSCCAYFLQFFIVILFILIQRKRHGKEGNLLKFSLGTMNPPLILWGVVVVCVSSIVLEPLMKLFPDKYLDMLSDAVGIGGWAVFTTVLLAPVMEEALFRGLILGIIRERYGAMAGVFLSALIFAVIHIIPQQMVNAFVIGLFLGYIYIRTGSLAAIILIHALNNAIAYVEMQLMGHRTDLSLSSMIGNDTWYWIVYGVSALLLVVAFTKALTSLAACDRMRNDASKSIPNNNPIC